MTDENQKMNPDPDEINETTNETSSQEETNATSETNENVPEVEETAGGQDDDATNKEKAPETEEASKLKEQLLRTMAEFDNYRKRTTKEKEQTFERGERFVIEAILPVIDNLERALSSGKDPEDPLYKGVQMTYEQMLSALKNLGVTQLEDMGKTFDPHFHDAMQHVDDENYGESEIVMVFRKGYQMNDTVIRPSLVKVAN